MIRQNHAGSKRLLLQRYALLAAACGFGVFGSGCQVDHVQASQKAGVSVLLRPAPLTAFRGADNPKPDTAAECDCNNPAHWDGHTLYVFNSAGHPWRSAGSDVFHLQTDYVRCEYDDKVSGGRWIECTWKAADGSLYGWYHLERTGICPGAHPESPKMNLTAPKIGAVKSTDNGAHWHDLGIVLDTPAGDLKCDTRNYYFDGNYEMQPPGLRLAAETLFFMGSNPVQRQKEAPTLAAADKLLDTYLANALKTLDANNVLYALESSSDYDPGPGLERIKARLLAINFADDLINPPELGILEHEIKRVRHGRAIVIAASDRTRGHGTHTLAAVWKNHLVRLLRQTEYK